MLVYSYTLHARTDSCLLDMIVTVFVALLTHTIDDKCLIGLDYTREVKAALKSKIKFQVWSRPGKGSESVVLFGTKVT